jgi:hypothetical protein
MMISPALTKEETEANCRTRTMKILHRLIADKTMQKSDRSSWKTGQHCCGQIIAVRHREGESDGS